MLSPFPSLPGSDASRQRLRERLGLDRLAPTVPARLQPEPGAGSGDAAPGAPFEVRIRTAEGSTIPAFLLLPAPEVATGAGVVLVAGHGRGIDDIVGPDPSGYHGGTPRAPDASGDPRGTLRNPEGCGHLQGTRDAGEHQDTLAGAFARAGLTVLCPEMESFGRRRSAPAAGGEPYADGDSSCRVDAPRHLLSGSTVLGRRVADAAAAADALRSVPGVDPARVAVAGGSGGGAVALLLAASDESVAAALVANYFCTFTASILAVPHCPCNIVPGLLAEGLEMAGIARLVAPRPLVLEAGQNDPIFPVGATREAFAGLPSAWDEQGAAGPRLVVTEEGHRFVAEESLRLLAGALGGSPS